MATTASASHNLTYGTYDSNESRLTEMMDLISKDLSEPYSIFTYRFFLHQWPELCHLVYDERDNNSLVGVIVGRIEPKNGVKRGYIAMLAVDSAYRSRGIGSTLVCNLIKEFITTHDVDEICLETERSNVGAIRLYERLGFAKDKRLVRYYLNGGDAFRLKLWLK